MIVRENIEFQKGKDPRNTLELGKKIILKLCNGFWIEGFLRNKEAAELLIKEINAEMQQTYKDAEREGETGSAAMDARDDVFYDYENQLEEIGFKLIDSY
jgi:hypothetical protein